MNGPLGILILLFATTAIAIVARRLRIPYPIAFVVGGTLLAFAPNVPRYALDPDLVFVLILPPLLFSGGWATDLDAFRRNRRAILLLATGLVAATTCLAAAVAYGMAPELTLAGAFVLGAVISPPDAVAASGVFARFGLPRRVVAIVEGEGLVNDATALVIYGFAVTAVSTGVFKPLDAALAFVGVSVGGWAAGSVCGWLVVAALRALRRHELTDTLIDNLFALLVPYAVYLAGNALHVSGVLATVAAGIYVSRRSSDLFEPESRLVLSSVWELLTFLLNAVVFLFIGLQLPVLAPHGRQLSQYVALAAAVSVVTIAVRVAWVYPGAWLPRLLSARVREREPAPDWRGILVVGWSGMRGIVSLAAALALPVRTAGGAPFPGRTIILFVTYCVIFATLVFQGLTLIPLLKWLRLDGDGLEDREAEVRVMALEAGIARIAALEPGFASTEEWEVAGRIRFEYAFRIGSLRGRLEGTAESDEVAIDHRLQREALDAEHAEVLRLRDAGEIPDEIFRKIRYDLDLAATRLA